MKVAPTVNPALVALAEDFVATGDPKLIGPLLAAMEAHAAALKALKALKGAKR